MQSPSHFSAYAHGKLLLTGEYLVMNGASALALPTQPGQWLEVSPGEPGHIHWSSRDEKGNVWLEADFFLSTFDILTATDTAVATRLAQIFQAIRSMSPDWCTTGGYQIRTKLEFSRDWGLGSSSTLISNLASWAGIDPYALLAATFGGSGYDIACAKATGGIVYQIVDGRPTVAAANLPVAIRPFLYFIYLGKKQDSRQGIAHYKQKLQNLPKDAVEKISGITTALLTAVEPIRWLDLLEAHECAISEWLGLPRVQHLYFEDFPGVVKSLGAWGGDFVLAFSEESKDNVQHYFNERGFSVVLPYEKLIR